MTGIIEEVGRRARRVASAAYGPIRLAREQNALRDLARQDGFGRKLAAAIRGAALRPEDRRVDAIEAGRAGMEADETPLVDGSLGPGGLYDATETVSSACGRSKQPHRALLLYNLALAFNPRCVLELGTNVGVSAAYLRCGQQDGSLTTMEASPYRIRLARKLHAEVGLGEIRYVEGLFADTLEGFLEETAPIDMAFIDGHHQHRPTLDYFEAIWRKAAPACMFIFDDIRWSPGMKQAWAELQGDSRLPLTVDLGWTGICISHIATAGKAMYRTPVLRSFVY